MVQLDMELTPGSYQMVTDIYIHCTNFPEQNKKILEISANY